MSRLQLLLRSFLPFVEAIEPGIAVFAPEWIQTDDSQQRLPRNPVRAPYSVVASTFRAIWHHSNSHPRSHRYAKAPRFFREYPNHPNDKVNPFRLLNVKFYVRCIALQSKRLIASPSSPRQSSSSKP